MTKTCSRRTFLKMSALGGSLALGSGALSACAVQTAAPPAGRSSPGSSALTAKSSSFIPDLDIALSAAPSTARILPGGLTNVWAYQAQVVKGDASSVIALPDTYLGPMIKVRSGQKVRVTFANNLPGVQPSTVHWHGLLVPDMMDGHPKQQINPGQSYVYEFEVKNRAATYWFHPHPHEHTPLQVNNGLAGLFIVDDDAQSALDLPSGEFDLPLVIQDRTFDATNQFVYNVTNMSGMMGSGNGAGAMNHGSMMGGMMGSGMMGGGGQAGGMMGGMNMQGMMEGVMGFLGQRVLVNGKPDYVLPVAARAYRLRLLNGSNARIYKLAWSDGTEFNVIGTDGGLLERPVTRQYLMLAPGERIEIWADFSRRRVGESITLDSQAFDSGESMSGMGAMMGSSAPVLGAPMHVMTVRVEKPGSGSAALPQTLTAVDLPRADAAVNAQSPRRFTLTLNGMQWLVNGRSFEMDKVAADEIVKLNTTETWEFVNALNPGQMMDQNGMPHPMHIHGVQFAVVGRSVLPELKSLHDAVKGGLVDEGWKDTVLLMPGETIRLAMRFTTPGRFLYHCHNLEHEAQGLMRNYEIRG